MTDLEHIIWDWNGTLLDDVSLVVQTLNSILAPRTMSPVTEEEYRRVFRFPVRDYYVDLGFDFEVDDWEQITTDFRDIYLRGADGVPLRTGIRGILQLVHDSGIGMSILSAAEQNALDQLVEKKGIRRFFDGVYGLSNHYAASKLETGRNALAHIDAGRERVLLVGDTTHDYEVAMELGINCVLVAGGHQAVDRLMGCECDVLTTIGDLADYVDIKEQP